MRMRMNLDELERREPAARGWLSQAAELATAWGVTKARGDDAQTELRVVRIVAARIWQMTRGRPSFLAIDVTGVHEDLTEAFVGAARVAEALRVVFRLYWVLAQRGVVPDKLAAEVQDGLYRLHRGEQRKLRRVALRRARPPR